MALECRPISEVRPFDMIVMELREEAIIMGLGLIIESDIFDLESKSI